MKPLRLSSGKIVSIVLLWLLSLGSSHSIVAQVQWDCMPARSNDWEVRTLFVDSTDSTLYVGGLFRTINGQPDTSIIGIRPDGSLLHLPNPKVSPVVVIRKWNGKLLAGGFGGLAEYNGTSWQKIIPGAIATVWSLHPYQGKLLVGGMFLTDSSLNADYDAVLKEWDGSTLTTFKGIDSIAHGFAVNAIAEYNGDLVIGGNIIPNVGDSSKFKDILRWTGTSWKPLGNTGLPGGGLDGVNDMVVLDGQLYVAGIFYEFNGSPGNCIARWDGTQWHRLGSGVGPGSVGIQDLAVQGDTLVVAGTFDIADGKTAWEVARYWNGHWCGNDVALDNVALCAVDYYGTVVVGGGFWTIDGDSCGKLAKVTSWGDCFAQATTSVPSSPEAGSDNLRAHPNPTYDRVQVDYAAARKGLATVRVLDVLGRTVLTNTVSCVKGANRFALDLSGIPSGLYHLQIGNSEGHGAIKIVKR